MPPLHSCFNASHTRSGPRSDPPMPIFTICVNFLPVTPSTSPPRTAAAKAASWPREARTSVWIAGEPANPERRAVCRAARRSVVFTRSPRNIASMRAPRSSVSASLRSRLKVSPVMRWRDRSSSHASNCTCSVSKRRGSAAAKSRKLAAPTDSACFESAAHAARVEFNDAMTRKIPRVRLRTLSDRLLKPPRASLLAPPHGPATRGLVDQGQDFFVGGEFHGRRPHDGEA